MIVMKFGGSSLGDAKRVRMAAEIIEKRLADKPLVVVSAHAKVTDMLIAAARKALAGDPYAGFADIQRRHHEIMDGLGIDREVVAGNLKALEELLRGISLVKELTARTLDFAMSFGERMSSKVVAAYLRQRGHNALAASAYDIGFITDNNFGHARPVPEAAGLIRQALNSHADTLLVTTGFIGKNRAGEITTVGRNGSDYSAAYFGAALEATEIQIWTDVDGVLTADPSVVRKARSIPALTFSEASEVAYYGGQVLHPSTMIPAVEKRIPIRVLNTFKPEHSGTLVVADEDALAGEPVKSVVYKENIYLTHITSTRMLGQPGFMAHLFEVFRRHNIVINMIATSEVTVSLTTDRPDGLEDAARDLAEASRVRIEADKAIICVVGRGMRHVVGLAARVFSAVAKAGVNIQMISQGASEINISFIVNNQDIEPAVKALHREFFE